MALTQLRRSTTVPMLAAGSYVTDGKRLPRVVSQLDADHTHVFASLEDCLTLEVRPYSAGELSAMRLRMVRMPSAASG